MRANLPGPADWIEMEVVDALPPERIVEEAVGAQGRRRTRGTYTLAELPGGGTQISFELAFLAMPAHERLAMPLVRLWSKRANATAMRRLHDTLNARSAAAAPASASA